MNLSEFGKLYKEYDLTNYNTYKIKSITKLFILVDNIIKLTNLVKYLEEKNIKYFILGGGSNIILPSYYDGVIIKLDFNELIITGTKVEVGASYPVVKLVKETIDNNLEGLEWAAGLPGSIAGAIIGNAGCFDSEISELIDSIEVIENNKIRVLRKSDIEFSYRDTSLKTRNLIIIKVILNLKKGNKEDLLRIIESNNQKRLSTQPLDHPSAGSVFKNPENDSAGRLIDELGLKGFSIGGAKISEKHANFIVNYNNATSEDVRKLIEYIQKEVSKEYNIDLVLEQQIIN